MATRSPLGSLFDGDGLPPADDLPWYVAPLPRWLENFGLHLAALIALVNLVGTAFGFWYYGFQPYPLSTPLITGQLAGEPLAVWPLVPDSPVATMFIGLALGLWWLGRPNEYVNAVAFFGCLKLGLWTPYVLTVFSEGFLAETPLPMYAFLFGSHLLMAVEAFLLHRFSEFPVRAVFVAVVWYGLNDLVDYFVPVIGTPHHTLVPGQLYDAGLGGFTHPSGLHYPAAAGAVVLTVAATFLALATRVGKLEADRDRRGR
ncbi:DUF1405 domain-containing protein [Candidatus Halobonum tyrrellensis]|uniref:DUF1405 domain-containing protein n=1 Tax=Candidatus Halobonum tyrrellensis G22 TaxID=1324957 RepID=V4GUZ4_9EURY|nr:DUF1405 domain-containing protein [Candidatus Halobonum tyrrellensis]ESP88956.1 hypothetical protein K933_06718 [Candidatus Halobonum tyrrellensis G22]